MEDYILPKFNPVRQSEFNTKFEQLADESNNPDSTQQPPTPQQQQPTELDKDDDLELKLSSLNDKLNTFVHLMGGYSGTNLTSLYIRAPLQINAPSSDFNDFRYFRASLQPTVRSALAETENFIKKYSRGKISEIRELDDTGDIWLAAIKLAAEIYMDRLQRDPRRNLETLNNRLNRMRQLQLARKEVINEINRTYSREGDSRFSKRFIQSQSVNEDARGIT